ncbi:MAG: hypothetical protein JNM84_22350 [Planctomycetes bacterium]|nr:hypothetical protein [Planctomycetota bacterium]
MSDYLDEFDLTVSTLWREERLSCPHRDLVQSFVDGELPPAQMDYLRFHIEEVGCAPCRELATALGAPLAAAPESSSAEREIEERLLRSTRTFLGASRDERRR